jgi:large subunit ribosomal protein L5
MANKYTKNKQAYIPRLITHYKEVVKPEIQKSLNIGNAMQIPRIEKVVLNMGMGDARENSNSLKNAVEEITLITGQKPVVTYAKTAISNFKIRAKDPVGIRVTLRREKMYEFLDRFISVATPRIRDFRGLPARGFDGRGNYNFGITEQSIFPEIQYDKIDKVRGMNVTIVTNAVNDEHAYHLLRAIGLPIRDKSKKVNQEGEA